MDDRDRYDQLTGYELPVEPRRDRLEVRYSEVVFMLGWALFLGAFTGTLIFLLFAVVVWGLDAWVGTSIADTLGDTGVIAAWAIIGAIVVIVALKDMIQNVANDRPWHGAGGFRSHLTLRQRFWRR